MAFELLESQEGAARMARAMQLPPNRRLEDILGPALFRRTAEAAAPLGLATETLQRLKPWALGLAFTLPPLERVRAAKGEPAYDAWLQYRKSVAAGKSVTVRVVIGGRRLFEQNKH